MANEQGEEFHKYAGKEELNIRNEHTSKNIASLAASIVNGSYIPGLDEIKSMAASLLTQAADKEVKGLPVAGYKVTQPIAAIEAVNVFKELEERTLRHIDKLMNDGTIRDRIRKAFADTVDTDGALVDVDPRLIAVGRTQLQGAFMFLCRAVFQPQRFALPEDETITEDGGPNADNASMDSK